jgi:hypothetical protein
MKWNQFACVAITASLTIAAFSAANAAPAATTATTPTTAKKSSSKSTTTTTTTTTTMPTAEENTGAKETPEFKSSSYSNMGKSEMNRQGKEYLLTGEIGFAVGGVPSAGATAGFFLDPNSLIQIDYTSGQLSWFDYDARTKTAGINYKHFVANSFYFRGGAAYRQVKLDYGRFLSFSSKREVGSSENIVADVAIGNQWQWSGFTMGCDWIGVMVPIARLKNDFDTTGYSNSDRSDAENVWQNTGKDTSVQLVRFYLGATF